MTPIGRYPYVLAIYPNTRGFAFTLFESALSLVDWGAKEIRGPQKNAACLARIESLFERYRPHVLVLQNMLDGGSRRATRITDLNAEIAALGAKHESKLVSYSRQEVLNAFGAFGVSNKHDIATAIASHVAALARYVPPRRKAWMAEPARMALFDAAALALTFLSLQRHTGNDRE
jgi:hypothetical protein